MPISIYRITHGGSFLRFDRMPFEWDMYADVVRGMCATHRVWVGLRASNILSNKFRSLPTDKNCEPINISRYAIRGELRVTSKKTSHRTKYVSLVRISSLFKRM